MESFDMLISILGSTIRLSIPLILAIVFDLMFVSLAVAAARAAGPPTVASAK